MANKLAGQRAKFSRARAIYYQSSDPDERSRASRLMAEVITEAPKFDFTEDMVTQLAEVPEEVRHYRLSVEDIDPSDESDEAQISALQTTVDVADVVEVGTGSESVYGYGYNCAPDRLKVGSTNGDPIARVAAQINTGTPDRPKLLFIIKTTRSRSLERVLHGILELRSRKIEGAGAEWFIATRDEVLDIYSGLEGVKQAE